MGQYYYIGTAFPTYSLDSPPDFKFDTVKDWLKTNLTAKDYEKSIVIRRYFDIENIRRLWKGEEFDPYGTMDPNELEEALLTRAGLADYVYDYLDKYDNKEERIKRFPELIAAYFNDEIPKADGFLKKYLEFERDFRLVMVGFRAKQLGRDVAVELQYEDPIDEVVAQILAQKDSPNYEPPVRYEALKQIFMDNDDNPLELQKSLLEYKLRIYEEMVGLDFFSIDRILAYLIEHIMVEKWFALSKQKGQDLIENFVQGDEK